MTVIYKDQPAATNIKASDIMWKQKQVARSVVREALISHTEAYIDMMCDGQGEMGTTRNELQASLGSVKESVEDLLEDIVADFTSELKKQLKEALYGAIVTGIKYDLAGNVKDVDVDISVNW